MNMPTRIRTQMEAICGVCDKLIPKDSIALFVPCAQAGKNECVHTDCFKPERTDMNNNAPTRQNAMEHLVTVLSKLGMTASQTESTLRILTGLDPSKFETLATNLEALPTPTEERREPAFDKALKIMVEAETTELKKQIAERDRQIANLTRQTKTLEEGQKVLEAAQTLADFAAGIWYRAVKHQGLWR